MLYINQALAPTTASITESAMLWDKESKQNREVDILIEDSTGPYPTQIGIECTERKGKLGTKDIEQLHTKHRNLGIGKTVVITNKGFFGPAIEYAKANKVQLLTFDTAMETQWPTLLESFKGISLTHVSFTCKEAEIAFFEPHNFDFDPTANVFITSEDFGMRNFYDYVYLRFQKEKPEVLSKKETGKRHWNFDPPLHAVDGSGVEAKISTIKLTYESLGTKISVQHGELNGSSFGYGISTEVAPYRRMAIVASPSGELTADGKPKLNINIHVDTD